MIAARCLCPHVSDRACVLVVVRVWLMCVYTISYTLYTLFCWQRECWLLTGLIVIWLLYCRLLMCLRNHKPTLLWCSCTVFQCARVSAVYICVCERGAVNNQPARRQTQTIPPSRPVSSFVCVFRVCVWCVSVCLSVCDQTAEPFARLHLWPTGVDVSQCASAAPSDRIVCSSAHPTPEPESTLSLTHWRTCVVRSNSLCRGSEPLRVRVFIVPVQQLSIARVSHSTSSLCAFVRPSCVG